MQMRAVVTMPIEPLLKRMLAEAADKAFAWAGCTEIFNLSGQPAMSRCRFTGTLAACQWVCSSRRARVAKRRYSAWPHNLKPHAPGSPEDRP